MIGARGPGPPPTAAVFEAKGATVVDFLMMVSACGDHIAGAVIPRMVKVQSI
jgi:hypothetical protein